MAVEDLFRFRDSVVTVIMAAEPVHVNGKLPDSLQIIRQGIHFIPSLANRKMKAGRKAVGEDKVHFKHGLMEVQGTLPVILFEGQLLLPPADVVDPVTKVLIFGIAFGWHSVDAPQFRVIRLKDTVLNIVTAGSVKGKEGLSLEEENLDPYEMEERREDLVHLSSLPFPDRIGIGPSYFSWLPSMKSVVMSRIYRR